MLRARIALLAPLVLALAASGCARTPDGSGHRASLGDAGDEDPYEDDDAGLGPDDEWELDAAAPIDGRVRRDAQAERDAQPVPPTRAGRDASAPQQDDTAPRDAAMPSPVVPPTSAPPSDASMSPPPPPVAEAGVPDAAPPVASPEDAGAAPGFADAGASPGMACAAGTYVGVFTGEISALAGLVRMNLKGAITIELSGVATDDKLAIRRGTLEGADEDKNPLKARVTGTLNCATRQLENVRLLEGEYRRDDPFRRGSAVTTTKFEGGATGTYQSDPPTMQGVWEVRNERGTRGGTGAWSARVQ